MSINGSASLILVVLAFVFTGCSVQKTTESATLESGGVGTLDSGLWQTTCLSNGSISLSMTLNFSSGAYTTEATAYGTGVCSNETYTVTETGSYVASAISPFGTGTLDWTLGSMTYKPLSTTQANSWNTNAFCGFTDWSLGQTKSVLGRTCDNRTYPAAGAIQYDIYSIEQFGGPTSQIGDLLFGYFESGHDGSSANTRPVSYDGNLIFRH